jgi:glycosyltransferase involved in cell wall biosynthesis
MRVLHVTEALGGGIQSAIANYVDGLDDAEHAIFARARHGLETHELGAWGVAEELYEGPLPGFFRRLRAKVIEERPDIVHLHSSFAGAARAVLPWGTRIVYSPHCFAMERRDVPHVVRWVYGAIELALAQRPQVVVAVSPREANIARRLGPRNPAFVVLNPSPFDPSSREEPEERDVVMVGRISAQKDPAFFAEVARQFAGEHVRFAWVGDGDDPKGDVLEESGVEVTGWLAPPQLRHRLSVASLYVHTAAWEGGPVSTIEAAAMGVPILARDIPSMRSLGYSLGGTTASELADNVKQFFDDPEFREQVVAATEAVASETSKPAMASALRSAYTRATAARASRGRPSAR